MNAFGSPQFLPSTDRVNWDAAKSCWRAQPHDAMDEGIYLHGIVIARSAVLMQQTLWVFSRITTSLDLRICAGSIESNKLNTNSLKCKVFLHNHLINDLRTIGGTKVNRSCGKSCGTAQSGKSRRRGRKMGSTVSHIYNIMTFLLSFTRFEGWDAFWHFHCFLSDMDRMVWFPLVRG